MGASSSSTSSSDDELAPGEVDNKFALVPVDRNANNRQQLGQTRLHEFPPENQNHVMGVFSMRRPRDAAAGIGSGLKSAAKGVGFGLVTLVAAPIAGASSDGVGGFAKGLVTGVVAGVVLPITGIGVGVCQVVRGVLNTPEAISKKTKGKIWNKKKRAWEEDHFSLDDEAGQASDAMIAYRLQREELGTPVEGRRRPAAAAGGKSPVADTTYYDLLGVGSDATQPEIRNAYYKLARSCHPDKHPDDPEAKAKFQALGEAYQILGDEERRKAYNEHGLEATQDMNLIDSNFFFSMLFGSEQLEPFVGKLKMTQLAEMVGDDSDETGDGILLKLEQKKRETEVAVHLRNRILSFVEGSEVDQLKWIDRMTAEATSLCQQSFGDSIIDAIGWTYDNCARVWIGKQDFVNVRGRYAKVQASTRHWNNVWRTASSSLQAAMAARKLAQKKEGEVVDPAEEAKNVEETLPLVLQTMLNFCLIDVEHTVKKATKMVLKDQRSNITLTRDKAEALIKLGQIFQTAAASHKEQNKDVKFDPRAKIEEAYVRAAQKADEERYGTTS